MQSLLSKAVILVGVLALVGLPVIDTLEVLVVLGLIAVVAFGQTRWPQSRPFSVASAVIAACVLAKVLLPQIRMQEGHNIFLASPGITETAMRRVLPDVVYTHAKVTFERIYDAKGTCRSKEGCWRTSGEITAPFAFSADGALQSPRYSRVVAFPSFDTLASFRGGFTNGSALDGQPNSAWYDSATGAYDPIRAQMPFFVVYEIPASLAGQIMCMSGDWFWETGRGGAISHHAERRQNCRTLTAADAGARAYGLSIDARLPLSLGFRIKPTPAAMAHLLRQLAGIIAAIALVALFIVPDWRRLAGFAVVAGPPALLMGFGPVYRQFREQVFAGGSDQLTHWTFGIRALQDAMAGRWANALRGSEDVFYFMPGYRYIRALEMLVFGETSMLALILLMATPYLLFVVARQVFSLRTAILALPVCWVAFYLSTAKLFGLSEAIAYPITCAALLFAFRALPGESEHDRTAWLFFAALSVAMAVLLRPNLGIAAVLLLAALLWEQRPAQRLRSALVLAIGFAPVGLLLAHNLYFGHQFVLATSAAEIPENLPTTPATYLSAAGAFVSLRWSDPAIGKIAAQLTNWLTGDGGMPFLVCVGVLLFAGLRFGRNAATGMVAQRWSAPRIRLLLMLVIGIQLPLMLFFSPSGRYTFLAAFLLVMLAIDLALDCAERAGLPWPPKELAAPHARLQGLLQ